MNVIDAIKARRSIRKFEDRPVEKEKIELLLRAAMQAPSASNEQPWEFIVVENKDTLKVLSEAHPYSMAMKNAPLGIVVLVDKKYLTKMTAFWEQDLAAASENILLEAVELGLGATWMAIAPLPERIDYIQKAFDLPEGVVGFSMIAIGYPLKAKEFEDRFNTERIHYEKF